MASPALCRSTSGRLLGGWAPLLCVVLGSFVAFLMPLVGVNLRFYGALRGFAQLPCLWGSSRQPSAVQSTSLTVPLTDLGLLPFKSKPSKELGTILEEEKDVVQADHLYTKALAISPCNERALVSRDRTLPLVEEIDQRYFSIIDSKVQQLMSIPKGNSALRRVMEEIYYHHIYHTVAIEGNTLTLSEIRHIIETRYAVPGKSLQEQNEAIGVDAAMKFINTTLLSRTGAIAIGDILEIHRRVLGYVDPVEGGRLRTNQVFVGHHIPPHPHDLQRHMEELVQWLNSEEALQLHPVEYAALAHYKLVYVHPFVDGNGRTSRLLMNLVLMQAHYPPITIRKEQRAEYYAALDTANEGDVRPFIRFIAKCTEMTLDTLLISTTERAVGLPAASQDNSCPECKQTISIH